MRRIRATFIFLLSVGAGYVAMFAPDLITGPQSPHYTGPIIWVQFFALCTLVALPSAVVASLAAWALRASGLALPFLFRALILSIAALSVFALGSLSDDPDDFGQVMSAPVLIFCVMLGLGWAQYAAQRSSNHSERTAGA